MTTVGEQVLARMKREGRFTPARQEPAPWPSRVEGPTYTGSEAEELFAEIRGEH